MGLRSLASRLGFAAWRRIRCLCRALLPHTCGPAPEAPLTPPRSLGQTRPPPDFDHIGRGRTMPGTGCIVAAVETASGTKAVRRGAPRSGAARAAAPARARTC